MSFAPIRYLAWARREFLAARHDLAKSGTPELPAAELGPPLPPDDYGAWGRYLAALSRRLKEQFDPHGILNPGRMVAGV